MTDEQFDMMYSLLDTMNKNICTLNENLNNLINATNDRINEDGREAQDKTDALNRIARYFGV